MKNPNKEKECEHVRSLRIKGLGLTAISKVTKIPRSTVKLWCRNIKLNKRQVKQMKKENIDRATARLVLIQQKRSGLLRKNSENLIDQGRNDLLMNDPLFFLGLGLYWGEGYKKGNKEIGITNSDPRILRAAIMWFKKFYNIEDTDFVARLTINTSYKKEAGAIVRFWSKELDISESQFTNTSYIKSAFKRDYPDRSHKGTVRVKVLKPLRIRERILSSINFAESKIR